MSGHVKYIPSIIGALVVSILPHLVRLPMWIITWCAFMWGYLIFAVRYGWPWPGRAVQLGLTALGIAGLLMTYSIRLGPNAFLGLLAIMAALKPFESRTHRDRMITLFLAYFLIISSLLQTESFAITLYMFVSVLVTTAALIRINDPYGRYRSDLKRSAVILGQALPLMLILFLLFPRIQGSLFGLRHGGQARTGFSDQLRPGSVSRLVENSEVAFRAEFEGDMPSGNQLYWRGLVFQRYDGKAWHRLNWTPPLREDVNGEEAIRYTLSLEPHDNRWIFALDIPARAPSVRSVLQRDFTIRSRRPVNRKERFQMRSYTSHKTDNIRWGVDMARQLPDHGNPRARELAARFSRAAQTPEEIVARAMDYFRENGFSYTLEPPLLGRSPVDDFLFRSKKGYCEHYATAFAFLMRAAGVPARIVGGYLGGEVNPFADYLIIRQSDAHVWVEVWYPDRGWIRTDPTLAVAPERISEGVRGALDPDELPGGFTRQLFGPLFGFMDQVRFGWDAVSSGWEAWFSGYSHEEQRALLERLGISWRTWKGPLITLLFALAVIAGALVGYWLIQFRKPRVRADKVSRYYHKFCKKLSRAGIDRRPGHGPLDFAAHASGKRRELKPEIDRITHLYIQLRYRENIDRETLKRFTRQVKAFRPNPGASRLRYWRSGPLI